MTILEWFIFFIAIQVLHAAATWKLYVRAGYKAWQAAVPVYNAVILMKIINRPWWWVILLFVPIVNLIMFIVVWVEIARSFGFNKKLHTFLAVVSLGLFSGYINYFTEAKHRPGRALESEKAWIPSLLFAIVAATVVHTYFMQPYTIPTSSLEKTLLVGDYLFVSKFHFGARTPMTPLSVPMVHDSVPAIPLPGTGAKLTKSFQSYKESPQLPYFRLPALQKIKRNDIVVFSWPTDTLAVWNEPTSAPNIRPIDKKSNYVKRCVGVPGDTLSVVNGYVHINGVKNDLPDRAKLQYSYIIETKGQIDQRTLVRYDITDGGGRMQDGNLFIAAASEEAIEKLRYNDAVKKITRVNYPKGEQGGNVFPPQKKYGWNIDNFGPIYIPKAGTTTPINTDNIALYKRLIEVYEGSDMGIDNTISYQGNEVLLNGTPLNTYTFKQDYYWMMGDNRHNSFDARGWGYVPQTHVVGKPVFVWMSFDPNKSFPSNIRWDRVFTTVKGEGKPKSYLVHFIVFLVLYNVGKYFWKKRKAKA